jgi:hypothetical protein
MKQILLTLAFVAGFAIQTSAQTQTEKDYEESLQQMFELSGSMETFQTVLVQVFDMFKNNMGQVPEEIWKQMQDEMSKTSTKDLVKLLAPTYKKYLSMEDLDQISAFYKTPAGAKLAKYTPEISVESMKAGEIWGKEIAAKILDKVKSYGL